MNSYQPSITAAILIIGNEIMSGRTHDTNGHYLAQCLDHIGIELKDMRMIPDEEDRIIDTVRTLSKSYTYVFTTGGIGPTHDDITSAAIAKAFNVPLIRHPDIEHIINTRKKNYPVVPATFRMADVPEGATLIGNPVTQIPGFKIKNVFVMAGVPNIMRGMFDNIKEMLKQGPANLTMTVDCNLAESHLADGLASIQNHFQSVQIGSYPYQQEEGWRVSIVLRAKDKDHLTLASTEVSGLIEKLGGTPRLV